MELLEINLIRGWWWFNKMGHSIEFRIFQTEVNVKVITARPGAVNELVISGRRPSCFRRCTNQSASLATPWLQLVYGRSHWTTTAMAVWWRHQSIAIKTGSATLIFDKVAEPNPESNELRKWVQQPLTFPGCRTQFKLKKHEESTQSSATQLTNAKGGCNGLWKRPSPLKKLKKKLVDTP